MATTGRPTGRPPKPTEVKRALGNPGHRPLPPAPLPGEGLAGAILTPEPPPLGPDGLNLWNMLWEAGGKWLSPDADRAMMAMLCQAQDEMEEIRRSMALGGVKRYYVVGNGQHVTHPMVNQLRELRTQITGWLSALGFSPTDRARLGLAEVRQPDELDELQKRREQRKQGRIS